MVCFAAAFACSAAAGWLVLPGRFYARLEQPVQFSHQVHAGPKNNLGCDTCHAFREDGSFAGVPRLDSCTGCHAAPMGTTAAERNFIESYVKPGREPVWLVYAKQPDNAWFSHAVHSKKAGLACETCHPGHAKSDTLKPAGINRISGYSRAVLRMDDCVVCHRRHGLGHSCLDCHK